VAAVLGVKTQTAAVWGCMSAADRCGWACCSLWGAATTSPGMCAVNDFWEYIYLDGDIVLRRIAVGSWRHFRLQLPYVTVLHPNKCPSRAVDLGALVVVVITRTDSLTSFISA